MDSQTVYQAVRTIALLGYGIEGQAALQYWRNLYPKAAFTICDANAKYAADDLPDGVATVLGSNYLNGLDAYDLIVRCSPQVHPKAIAAGNSVDVAHKTTSNVNEFMRVCPSRNIIGVTGTKGKGTTSTLIAKILEAAGKRVHLGGNIGVAALSMLDAGIQPDDYVVLELSNFQLIDMKHSPHIAVCLMVVPEHLDWHKDMAEYVHAKQQLFAFQTESDIAIYYPLNKNSVDISNASVGLHIPYFDRPGASIEDGKIIIGDNVVCDISEVKLLGDHNLQNVCAAVTAVWQVTQNIAAIQSVIASFSGLPHRIEFVRELDAVRYYNDSFATGLHATEAAILAVKGPKVVILGGFDRMLELSKFADFAHTHADEFRKALVVGASAERLAAELTNAGFNNFVVDNHSKTMPQIVATARSLAEPGDAVVLSPGFASFDMFKNFEDRGNKYKDAVNNL